MKATQTTLLILSLLLAAACGGKSSIASKSAAAYRNALTKGIPVGEGGHGGHQAEADHSQMAGMDHAKMAGMDHSKMADMDHTKMAGMDHANMPGMQHGGSMAGMQHGGMTMQAPPNVDLSAPASNAAIRRLSPSSTLRADDFDAPAAVAVSEAAKAAQTPHHQ